MKLFTLALGLLVSTSAFSAPMGVKGQSDTAAQYPYEIHVPNKQATDIGGKTLIESGNNNLLANPSFEHSTASTSWTLTAGTMAAETSTVIHGKKSLKLTLSSQTLAFYQDSTLYASQFAGSVQGLAMVRVKTSVSGVKLCSRQAGTTSSSLCVNVSSGNTWGLYKVPYILGTTSNGLALVTSSAVSGDIYVDDAFVGAVDLKIDSSPVGPWVDYGAITITATTTAPTKATTKEYDSVRCRQSGQDYECEYRYAAASATGATAGSGGYIFSLPSGIEIDTTVHATTSNIASFSSYVGTRAVSSIGYGDAEVTGATGDTSGKCDISATSSTTFQVNCFTGASANSLISSSQFSAMTNAGIGWRFYLKFKGKGLSSNHNSYSSNNANYSRTQYTPIFSGVTSTVHDCYHSRDGQFLDVDCKFTVASSSATEMRVSLPVVNGVSITSATSTGIRIAGQLTTTEASAGTTNNLLIESNVGYFTFGVRSPSTSNAFTKLNGNAYVSAGAVVAFTARIPISQWDNSNIIIAQLSGLESCSSSAQCETEYYADISSTGVVSGEEIDFINGNCSVTSNTFTCTYNTSQFTQAPTCSIKLGPGATQVQKITETSSGFSYSAYNSGGTLVNVAASVSCRKRGNDYVTKTARAVASDQNIATPGRLKDRKLKAFINGSTTTITTACTTTPCSVYSNFGFDWVSTATRSAAGTHTFTTKNGVFAPNTLVSCIMQAGQSGNTFGLYARYPISDLVTDANGALSIATIEIINAAGANTDGMFYIECEGQAP